LKEVDRKKKKQKLGHKEVPREQFYRPKTNNTETPPVPAEKPKEDKKKMTQQQKPQEQMTQRKKGGTSGARTHDKENKGKNDAASESSTNETVDSK
jgi:hypothetical protein